MSYIDITCYIYIYQIWQYSKFEFVLWHKLLEFLSDIFGVCSFLFWPQGHTEWPKTEHGPWQKFCILQISRILSEDWIKWSRFKARDQPTILMNMNQFNMNDRPDLSWLIFIFIGAALDCDSICNYCVWLLFGCWPLLHLTRSLWIKFY